MADQPNGPVAAPAQAGHMLERARWAARSFATYSHGDVDRIVRAVAEVAHANAQKYAEWAVAETGFGVVEHKVRKNQACSRGLLDTYAGHVRHAVPMAHAHAVLRQLRARGVRVGVVTNGWADLQRT